MTNISIVINIHNFLINKQACYKCPLTFPLTDLIFFFQAYGHENISVLDGGLSHYGLNANATFASGVEETPKVNY